jgi:uncharacterized protein YlxW (UPF0749 family)
MLPLLKSNLYFKKLLWRNGGGKKNSIPGTSMYNKHGPDTVQTQQHMTQRQLIQPQQQQLVQLQSHIKQTNQQVSPLRRSKSEDEINRQSSKIDAASTKTV